MSRSFRTQKEAIIARRHIVRVGNGAPFVPRIIERAPAPGDIHPVPKRNMRFFLERVPVEYLYDCVALSCMLGPMGARWEIPLVEQNPERGQKGQTGAGLILPREASTA